MVFLAPLLAKFALGRLASRVPAKVWIVGGIVVALVIGLWTINNRAYNRGYETAGIEIEQEASAEQTRQFEANAAAMRIAQDEILRLQLEKERRDGTIDALRREARQDPNADRPAVGIDSVRRLNAILEQAADP